MASGLVCRANRPNTWLHRPACKREEKPCQLGAVLANSEPSTHGTKRTSRDVGLLVRFWGEADVARSLLAYRPVADDPNVWSGRALQEDFVKLADVRSCINVSGL